MLEIFAMRHWRSGRKNASQALHDDEGRSMEKFTGHLISMLSSASAIPGFAVKFAAGSVGCSVHGIA